MRKITILSLMAYCIKIFGIIVLAIILANCSGSDDDGASGGNGETSQNWCIYPVLQECVQAQSSECPGGGLLAIRCPYSSPSSSSNSNSEAQQNWCINVSEQQCIEVFSSKCFDGWILVPACPYSSSSGSESEGSSSSEGSNSSSSEGSSSSIGDSSSSSSSSSSVGISSSSIATPSSSSLAPSSSSVQQQPSSSSVAPSSSSSSGSLKGTFTDTRDNQTYKTVEIGTQVWMAENLNYAESGACYKNDASNCATYGRLYDWAAAKMVCPTGWHLPSRAECDVLMSYVHTDNGSTYTPGSIFSTIAGKYLKTVNGWNDYSGQSGNGLDTYGFAGLPGGMLEQPSGIFFSVGNYGYWWTATDAPNSDNPYYMDFGFNFESAIFSSNYNRDYSLSVRCIKD